MILSKRALYSTLWLAAILCTTGVARAHDSGASRLRLHAGLGLGVLGAERAEATKGEVGSRFPEEDLVTTWGFYAGLELALHDNITLGAELGYARWNTEQRENPPDDGFSAKAGRSGQVDLLLRPKLHLEVLTTLELYAVPVVGVTYYLPPDDSGTTQDVEFDAQGGPGFAVGGALGLGYFVTDHLGLIGEVGYLQRYFSGGFDATIAGSQRHFERDFRMGQLQLHVGLAFAF